MTAHKASTRTGTSITTIAVKGVTLIELMVSVVIGLFLVLGATSLYVRSRNTADIDDSVARLQETARYAMSVIETDVRMSNYWGLVNDANLATNKVAAAVNQGGVAAASGADTLVPSSSHGKDCGANYAVDVTKYVQVSSDSFPGTFTSHCAAHSNAVTTADTLTVRRASTTIDTAVSSDKLQICASRNSLTIILGGACTAPDEIHSLVTNTYYVDQASDQSSSLPSLRRISLVSGAAGAGPDFRDDEVVAGVEDMQIELGWGQGTETAVSGTPPANAQAVSYLQPSNASITGNTGQVVAVRVWLLIRSETTDKSYKDTNIYEYGNRSKGAGTNVTNDLNNAANAGKAYKPADNYRRLLVSKTFFIRNAIGT